MGECSSPQLICFLKLNYLDAWHMMKNVASWVLHISVMRCISLPIFNAVNHYAIKFVDFVSMEGSAMKKTAICFMFTFLTTCSLSVLAAPPPQVSMYIDIPGRSEKIQKGSALATMVKHYGEPIVRGHGSYCSNIVWTNCRGWDSAEQWQYLYKGDVINIFHRNLKVLHIEKAEQ